MAPEYLPNPNLDPRLFATLGDVEKRVAYEESAYARLRADKTGTTSLTLISFIEHRVPKTPKRPRR